MSVKSSVGVVTDGLVFYMDAGNDKSYPGSGTTWTDLKVADAGVLTNGPIYNSANGGYIAYDGANDYSTTADLDDFMADITVGHTFDVWIKTPSSASTEFFGFLSNSDEMAYRLKTNAQGNSATASAGLVGAYLRDAAGARHSFDVSVGVNDDAWHNIVIVLVGTANAVVYHNGVSTTVTTRENAMSNTFTTSSHPAWVGAVNNRGATLRPGDVDVSSFKVYNKGLSASEVLQNYNALKNRFI